MSIGQCGANFTSSDSLKRGSVFSEMKVCEQGSNGCLLTFSRPIGSVRKVCDACLVGNINFGKNKPVSFDRAQSPSVEDRKQEAWSGIRKTGTQARNQEHIQAVCLRKFAYASFSAALKTVNGRKTNRTHKKSRKMQPFVCEFRIHTSDDPVRRGTHFHVGGDHEDFGGSDF
jgi:hypothetical protein